MSTHNQTHSTLSLPSHLSADRLDRAGRLEFEAMTDCEDRGALILKPYTRDVAMRVAPIVVERDGLTIEVERVPFWYASIDTQTSLGWVDAYGNSMEEAVGKALARLKRLQAQSDEGEAA